MRIDPPRLSPDPLSPDPLFLPTLLNEMKAGFGGPASETSTTVAHGVSTARVAEAPPLYHVPRSDAASVWIWKEPGVRARGFDDVAEVVIKESSKRSKPKKTSREVRLAIGPEVRFLQIIFRPWSGRVPPTVEVTDLAHVRVLVIITEYEHFDDGTRDPGCSDHAGTNLWQDLCYGQSPWLNLPDINTTEIEYYQADPRLFGDNSLARLG